MENNKFCINNLCFEKEENRLSISGFTFLYNLSNDKTVEFYEWLTNQLGFGWISVEDNLPEKTSVAKDKVILIDEDEFTGFYSYDYESWVFFNPIDQSYHDCKPTHWREKFPLPKEDV